MLANGAPAITRVESGDGKAREKYVKRTA